jgi:hypothetical protein
VINLHHLVSKKYTWLQNVQHLRTFHKKNTTFKNFPQKVLRVAYLAAVWENGLPLGQYFGHLNERFAQEFHRHVIKDPSGDSKSVDSYDAIWGTIFATDARFKLVHVYRKLDEVIDAVNKYELPDGIDLLVLGNWIHPLCARDEEHGKGIAEKFLNTLRNLELEASVLIFPPLDYAWHFAQKAHFYVPLQRFPLPLGAFVIPTIAVPQQRQQRRWKQTVEEFVQHHDTELIVFKRELSEISKHVLKADVSSIPKLPGRDKDDGFRWMALLFSMKLILLQIDSQTLVAIFTAFRALIVIKFHL